MHEQRRVQDTHSAFILARPQKAPSVSLLMLFLWSFSTSRLLSPWKVSPSMSLSLFLFSSLEKAKQNRDTWSSVATTHAAPGPRGTAARAVAPSPNGGPREQTSEELLRGACSYRDRYMTFKAGARGRVSERGRGLGPGPLQ